MRISDLKNPQVLTGGLVSAPQTQYQPQSPQTSGLFSKVAGGYVDYLKGLGKGALSTYTSISGLGEKAIRAATPMKLENALLGPRQPQTQAERLIPESYRKPQGAAQTTGFAAEQIAETLLPLSRVAKIERAIDTAFQGSKLLRVGAKTLTEAAVGGGSTLLQTGSTKEAGKSAALFGGTKLATGTVGEILRATKIPDLLYQRIFKNNYRDMVTELRQRGTDALRRSNPQQYTKLVEAGIITESAGKSAVNESLAKQALERGLKGSIDNMAHQVVSENLEMEHQARQVAKGVRSVAVPGSERLANVLLETAQRYENVGSGEVARRATKFAQMVRTGEVSGEDALKLRRFLDGMRLRSSFDTTANTLSQGQENFRYWSDTMRGRLARIPGMEAIMKEYKYTIEALESLGKEATRRGNSQIIGLVDSIFLGGAALGNPAAAIGMGAIKRSLNSPTILTNLGSAINRSGNMSKFGQLLKTGLDEYLRNQSRNQ